MYFDALTLKIILLPATIAMISNKVFSQCKVNNVKELSGNFNFSYPHISLGSVRTHECAIDFKVGLLVKLKY